MIWSSIHCAHFLLHGNCWLKWKLIALWGLGLAPMWIYMLLVEGLFGPIMHIQIVDLILTMCQPMQISLMNFKWSHFKDLIWANVISTNLLFFHYNMNFSKVINGGDINAILFFKCNLSLGYGIFLSHVCKYQCEFGCRKGNLSYNGQDPYEIGVQIPLKLIDIVGRPICWNMLMLMHMSKCIFLIILKCIFVRIFL
jgi:hypothetical protein